MSAIWRCHHCETVMGMVELATLTIHPMNCRFRVEGHGEVIQSCKKCGTLNILNLGEKSLAI
jgi:hypothetical protein